MQARFLLFKIVGIACLLMTVSCKKWNNKQVLPEVKKGSIDLSEWDFDLNASIPLKGEWLFIPNQFINNSSTHTSTFNYQQVPSSWHFNNGSGFGTYQVKIILPKKKKDIAIKLLDISSAYCLYQDTSLLLKVGNRAKTEDLADALYQHRLVTLNTNLDTVLLSFQVSNYISFKGGILSAPVLGVYDKLYQSTQSMKLFGILMMGALIACACFHFAFGFYKIAKKYHLYASAVCALFAIHLFCLNERLLYDYCSNWNFNIRLEALTIILVIFFGSKIVESFFELSTLKVIRVVNNSTAIVLVLIVTVTPIHIAGHLLVYMPFYFTLAFAYINGILFKAYKQRAESISLFLVLSCIMFVLVLYNNFFFWQHVGSMEIGHISLFVCAISLTVFLSKQSALTFLKTEQLTLDLRKANEDLNQQNSNLEEEIAQRTKQLIENEKKTYQLELENKQRDLETIKINNQLKQDISKELIIELEKLQKSDVDLKVALKKLIAKIKQQFGLSNKLNILEKQSDIVNAEFYDRLATHYPKLTKLERELCSLIKLNLSTKDISVLQKTSTNAINVARSRLRKKLELPEEIDLEVFIRKI